MKPLGSKKTKSVCYGINDRPIEWVGADKGGRSAEKRRWRKGAEPHS